jgi:hypothetical protein
VSVAELSPYKDRLLIQSDPNGCAVVFDADTGKEILIDWEAAILILAKMEAHYEA